MNFAVSLPAVLYLLAGSFRLPDEVCFSRRSRVSLFQFDKLTVLQVSCGRIENPAVSVFLTVPRSLWDLAGSAWLTRCKLLDATIAVKQLSIDPPSIL
jgi:hypothetical protein